MKKVPAIGMLVSIAVAILAGIFASSLGINLTQSLYTLSGLGLFGFGTWSSVILLKE